MQVQVQVQPQQQQIQESAVQQQSVQVNAEHQIVQVSVFLILYFFENQCLFRAFIYFQSSLQCSSSQVQIQGQQQQMLGQVLQVPSGSHQQLQGLTTAQLIQPGDLTEEQHQQVSSTPY
jgi:hypothetical protein